MFIHDKIILYAGEKIKPAEGKLVINPLQAFLLKRAF